MNKNKILLILIMLIASIGIAQAETGTLYIEAAYGNSYTVTAHASATVNVMNTKFRFDNTDYTSISNIQITIPAAYVFPNSADSTTFVLATGGSGNGVVSYVSSTGVITWSFYNTTVTASSFTLTYARDIFTGGTYRVTGNTDDAPTAAQPIKITLVNGNAIAGAHLVQTSIETTNTYNVTYYNLDDGLHYNVNLQKSTVNTWVNISNQTTLNFNEGAYDTTGFNFSKIYDTGIIIRATSVTGDYDQVAVNTTGMSGIVPPGESPSDNINPDTGVGIVFDSEDYAIGDIANISWIRTSTTPFTYTDKIRITYPNSGTLILLSSPPDSGNYQTILSNPGTYEVEFIRVGLFGDETVLDSDTATVGAETPSYIVAPAQVAIGKLFNVTYKIGWTLSQGTTAWVRTYHWDTALGQWAPTYQSFSVSGVKDVQTNASILVTKQGDYMISLCDVLQGCKASTNTEALFNGSEVTTTITTSNITIDKNTYSYGETILVKTAVDNYNWSNKQIVVDYIDYGMGISQNQQYIQSQIESFPLYISDLTFSGAGASGLRLIGKNDTGDYTLAVVNFTLSATDSEGYGLTYTGNSSCVGSTISINAIVPAGELANLSISSDDARFNKEYMINGSKIIKYTIKAPGTYYLVIRKDGEARRMIIFNTASCQVAATPGATGGAAMQTQTDNLLGSGMFTALIILLLFAGGGMQFGGIGGAVIGFGAGFIFCAVYGLVPLWSLFLFAILVITALAVMAGKELSGGGQ